MSLENQFIPYKVALELKKLGFREKVLATYFSEGAWQIDCTEGRLNFESNHEGDYTILAPLYQQVFDWFRKEHDFDLCWKPMSFVGVTFYYDIEIHHPKYVWDKPPKVTGKTYEEVRLACLEKLIEIVKNK